MIETIDSTDIKEMLKKLKDSHVKMITVLNIDCDIPETSCLFLSSKDIVNYFKATEKDYLESQIANFRTEILSGIFNPFDKKEYSMFIKMYCHEELYNFFKALIKLEVTLSNE